MLVPAAVGAAPARITAIDTSGYPTVHATIVTPTPSTKVPALRENGKLVIGFEATNLGSEKSVGLALDRSQSMRGQAMADAAAAAREFVRTKPAGDRIAVFAVGKRAVQLTSFSSSKSDADAALRTIEVDSVRGTALYDSVVLAVQALAADVHGGRVLVLLTDGQEVSSDASLDAGDRRRARREGHRLSDCDREPELPARAAPAPGEGDRRPLSGRQRYRRAARDLRGARGGAPAHLERLLRDHRPPGRAHRARLGRRQRRGRRARPGRCGRVGGSSKLEPFFELGPAVVSLLVGLCVLLGTTFLLRAPIGSGLKRRIAPHLGEGERKRAKGPAQERFATASSIMRATEGAFGHLQVWHKLHRLLERADLPLRTVELVYAAIGQRPPGRPVPGRRRSRAASSSSPGWCSAASIPIFVVSFKAKRRLTALEDQLPDLLITLAASLKAGHSFRQGIQAVVDEGLPPASKEFKRVLTETQLGRPMDEALADMAERVGSKNLAFVVTAVTIQRQVGGSLAGIFDMVAEAVRQRQQFARKIRSLTAMGRASAYVLVGVPFFMLGVDHADEPGVHGAALPHVDGQQAVDPGCRDDLARHPLPSQNRLL